MIQELFGGADSALIAAAEASDRRSIAFNNGGGGGGIVLHGTPATSPSPVESPSSSSTSSVAAALTANTTAANQETQQNLRCPRCDSSNTKFCYYNNYNLTQPRHFCKTCRRYWTKGGALRNVPIGGGCRKNKTSSHISSVTKSSVAKYKALPADMVRTSHLMGGFEAHELSSGQVSWAPTQSSQILALLTGNPINPNPSPMKEEGNIFGSNMTSHGVGNSLEPPFMGELPFIGLCSSFWRNNGNNQQMSIQQNQHGYLQPNELQNQSSMQALYQRIKLSTGDSISTNPNSNQSCSNTMASSSSSSIMEQPLMATTTSADQMVYWQNTGPSFCWSDLPTTTSNGAYP